MERSSAGVSSCSWVSAAAHSGAPEIPYRVTPYNHPDKMCVNQTSMETCWFLFCYKSPERSMVRTSVEILPGGSSPRAAFYIPVAQVMEQRSPKPQVAGLIPAGNARLCMTGGRHAENSGASGRESSRCSGFVYDRQSCLLYAVIAQLAERRPFKAGQRW